MTIIEFDAVLGLGLSKNPDDILRSLGTIAQSELPEKVLAYVEQREVARIASNWMEADRLRDAVGLLGYEIEDSSQGPKITKL